MPNSFRRNSGLKPPALCSVCYCYFVCILSSVNKKAFYLLFILALLFVYVLLYLFVSLKFSLLLDFDKSCFYKAEISVISLMFHFSLHFFVG